MQQCGAKTRKGTPCPTPAMPNGRCRMHGGLQPQGFARPQTTHGRYSKHLPTRLASAYAEAQRDPELVSVREDLALIDARISDVLGRVDTKEAGATWKEAKATIIEGRKEGHDPEKTLTEVEALLDEGQADWRAWSEVLDLIERRRKLAETESKRLAAMGQQITSERAMLLLAAVVDVIRRHVTDRTQLAAISRDVGVLVGPG